MNSVLLLVLLEDFSCLLIGSSSSAFLLTFSFSMKLGETVIYCSLEAVFLCRSTPVYTECNIFGAKTVFHMDTSHIFPQSMLDVIP